MIEHLYSVPDRICEMFGNVYARHFPPPRNCTAAWAILRYAFTVCNLWSSVQVVCWYQNLMDMFTVSEYTEYQLKWAPISRSAFWRTPAAALAVCTPLFHVFRRRLSIQLSSEHLLLIIIYSISDFGECPINCLFELGSLAKVFANTCQLRAVNSIKISIWHDSLYATCMTWIIASSVSFREGSSFDIIAISPCIILLIASNIDRTNPSIHESSSTAIDYIQYNTLTTVVWGAGVSDLAYTTIKYPLHV